ncbi:MAG TPA: cyclase family protein [Solirubrobacterales bacterium]|nr:cyclase family protein [Solirubrobacterales bacterium]
MGRNKDGVFAKEWSPPDYEVDENGKVVGGYRPRGKSNWGRWGEDDARGTANLIDAAKVAAAARLVRRGKVFSLSLPIDHTVPTYPTRRPPRHYFNYTGADAVLGNPRQSTGTHAVIASDDSMDLNLQGSTQWDGLGHCQTEDTLYNGFWSGNVTPVNGDPCLGVEHNRESFVGRAILLDVPRHLGVDSLEPGFAIGADLLDEVCASEGVEAGRGDMVLLRTGHLRRWSHTMSREEKGEYFDRNPGLGASGIPWFADRDIAATASDTSTYEVFPPEEPDGRLAVHRAFLIELGLTIGELWDLEALAADCAEDGVYEFMLIAPPLYIPKAVGSPLNPIAIK